MIARSDAGKLILDLLEETALVIGGLVAVHHVEDDFIWRLARSLDVIRRRFLRRLEGVGRCCAAVSPRWSRCTARRARPKPMPPASSGR